MTTRAPQDHLPAKPRATRPRRTSDATEALQREADTDGIDWLTCTMSGQEYRIQPPNLWRQSTNDAVAQGRLNEWARIVMHPDDLDDWFEADPTNTEAAELMDSMEDQIRSSLGDTQPSPRSSRSMRRR